MGTEQHDAAPTVRLADGRRVGYRVYGAADGVPVLALHGTPGAHLKYAVAGEVAAQLGLRLIAGAMARPIRRQARASPDLAATWQMLPTPWGSAGLPSLASRAVVPMRRRWRRRWPTG